MRVRRENAKPTLLRRVLSCLVSAAMVVAFTPVVALGGTPLNGTVDYLNWDASNKRLVDAKYAGDYTQLSDSDGAWGTSGQTTWYVVAAGSTVAIGSADNPQRVTVEGNVNLILADNCNLTVNGGIQVSSGNSLTVYGQTGGTGKLTAQNVQRGYAGIGSDIYANGGNITINGGNITATGGEKGAGIGGGGGKSVGNITINGGSVKAASSDAVSIQSGAGIGGGCFCSGGNITINGGKVEATGGASDKGCGAGIGGGGSQGGSAYNDGQITVTGGSVMATGGESSTGSLGGAGIGGGSLSGSGGTITISGGDVTADGGSSGAGIGGGHQSAVGNVTISGGTVKANGGSSGAGIGSGYYSSSGAVGNVTISGGIVNATGGTSAAGIGKGYSGSNATFSTGTNGNAVIFASSGSVYVDAISDTTNQDKWSGVVFEEDGGKVYGTSAITPTESFTIDNGKTLTIPESAALTIASGKTLTNNGTIEIKQNGELVLNGTLDNRGAITGNGSISPEEKKLAQTTPPSPTVQSVTVDSITLAAMSGGAGGVEYSKDGTSWQDGTAFSGLQPAQNYTFYARYKGTGIYKPSDSSSGAAGYTALSAPQNLAWSGTTATWDTVTNVSGYKVQLYQNGSPSSSSVAVSGTNHIFDIAGSGSYTFKVKAISTVGYADSVESTSGSLFSVSFNTNGADAIDTQYVVDGEKATAPASPEKTGYTFDGWFSDAGCNNQWNFDSNTVQGVTTLYAKWTINQYTITFNTDGGTAIAPITLDYGSTISKPSNPTKTGYTFKGWDKTIPDTMPAENKTLTAQWTLDTYTITYVLDNGTNDDGNPATYTVESDTITLKPGKRSGYTFEGWYDDNDQKVTEIAKGSTGNKTLTAKWSAIYVPPTYTVPVTGEGGVVVKATVSGSTAVVAEISASALEGAVSSGEGGEAVTTVTIDLSGLPKGVAQAQISKSTVENLLAVVNDAGNAVESVTVDLGGAAVVVDAEALAAIAGQAKGGSVTIGVKEKRGETLNGAQQQALSDYGVVELYFEAQVKSGGAEIHDFGGGSVRVSVAFEPQAGHDPARYVVLYVAEDGQLERFATAWATGMLSFAAPHFSAYAVVYVEDATAAAIEALEALPDAGELKASQAKEAVKKAQAALESYALLTDGQKALVDDALIANAQQVVVKGAILVAKADKKAVVGKVKNKAFSVKVGTSKSIYFKTLASAAGTKVTYKKASGSSYITVSKAGKVTAKKGMKKGKTYTAKIKVTCGKSWKYVKVTVKVQ